MYPLANSNWFQDCIFCFANIHTEHVPFLFIVTPFFVAVCGQIFKQK